MSKTQKSKKETKKAVAPKMRQRSRGWCFTVFNYENIYNDIIISLNECSTYYIIGKEICPSTENNHLQGYAYFKNAITGGSFLKKIIDPEAHIEKAKGSAFQNFEYCSKDKDFVEFGKRPKQGERVDLEELADKIKSGEKTVKELTEDNPYAYHKFGRTLDKLEGIKKNKVFRKEMTQGIWLYGPTGTGKSHRAFTMFGEFSVSTHYLHTTSEKWWDGYEGQDIVIINDFRGEIPFGELLQLVDKWPYTVPRRYIGPIQFIATKLIITSSMHPDNVYHNIAQTDRIDQLHRRFDIYQCEEDGMTERKTEARERELNRQANENNNTIIGQTTEFYSDESS